MLMEDWEIFIYSIDYNDDDFELIITSFGEDIKDMEQ